MNCREPSAWAALVSSGKGTATSDGEALTLAVDPAATFVLTLSRFWLSSWDMFDANDFRSRVAVSGSMADATMLKRLLVRTVSVPARSKCVSSLGSRPS